MPAGVLGLLVSMAIASREACGDPVVAEVFQVTHPDGTSVDVRVWGDEFYRRVESMDGYTLVRDPASGTTCYARLSVDGSELVSTGVPVRAAVPAGLDLQPHIRISPASVRAKVAAARARVEKDRVEVVTRLGRRPLSVTATNAVEGIVLLVDFDDEVATIAPAEISDYCNQVGYTGYGNNGSVRDYFYDVSDGNLTYTNFVPTSYYRALQPKSYYDESAVPCCSRARDLIYEALEDLDAQGFDFSQYDSNHDGVIDAVNCFYAGTRNGPWSYGLWPHSGWLWFSADGVSTERYQITDLGTVLRLRTFCHENGHMVMRWPDLYDYGYESTGVGNFCLMCYGASDTNPAEPCAYLKYIAGWATTTLLTTPQASLTVPSGVNTIYKYEHPTQANEYYLIENRQKTGRDTAIPDAGLAVWHIDENGDNDNEQMTPGSHYEATLVQADGEWDLEHNRDAGDSTDLWGAPEYGECTPYTYPNTNWWDRSLTPLFITEISSPGPTMTFSFRQSLVQTCDGQKLTASDAGEGDEFGEAVAIDGGVAVVGARLDDDAAGDAGAVYVYRATGTTWGSEVKLFASDAEADDEFGGAVAISGDVILVGASEDTHGGNTGAGSAYVVRWDGLDWIEEQKLTASDAAAQDFFGAAVAIDGDLAVVAAPAKTSGAILGAGAVYLFRWNGSTWIEEEKLTAFDSSNYDTFGLSVSVSGDFVAVASPNDDDVASGTGSVYVYRRSGGSWSLDDKLTASDAVMNDHFGRSVSLVGSDLLVGTDGDDDMGADAGSVYHFERVDSNWTEQQELYASDAAAGDNFGRSVSLSDGRVVVGAYGQDEAASNAGAAYVFRRPGGWLEDVKLTAPDAADEDRLGDVVAASGDYALLGVRRDGHAAGIDAGSVYLFPVGSDCNKNYLADVCDINAEPSLDLDNDGVIDCACLELTPPKPHRLPLAGDPISTTNRYISVQVGDSGRSQAVRVRPATLPPPYDQWDCATGSCQAWHAGVPIQVCENSGQDLSVSPPNCGPAPGLDSLWYWAAPLVCGDSDAHWMDWTTLANHCTGGGSHDGDPCVSDADCGDGTCGHSSVVHLYHGGIVPSHMASSTGPIDRPASYEVQVIDAVCNLGSEEDYSEPLLWTQAGWGDVVLSVADCPNGPPDQNIGAVTDVVSVLNKFANTPCAPSKARTDLVDSLLAPGLDFKIDITDVVQCLGAFTGGSYPVAPGNPCG